MLDEPGEQLTKDDRAALRLAFRMIMAGDPPDDPGRGDQIASMVEDSDRSWFEIASFCSYVLQNRNLNLGIHEPPCVMLDRYEAIIAEGPGTGDGGQRNWDYPTAKVLEQMLKLKISIYDPDPAAAIRAARRKRAAR